MRDLTEFLLARIGEDEAVAREATDDGHRWLLEEETVSLWPDDREPANGFLSFPRKAHAHHAVTWNPARVLAECEAKRELIALHPEAVGDDLGAGAAWAYDEMLRRLALPYADHPDYRGEWRP